MQVFKVEQWMNKNVISLTRDKPVVDAAELMRKHDVGCIIVIDDERPIGLVTERDIIRKIVAKRRNPEVVPLEDIMVMNLVTVDAGTPIKDVSKKMVQYNIKKMPVVEGEKLKGIITTTDIVRIMAEFNQLYEAKEIIEMHA